MTERRRGQWGIAGLNGAVGIAVLLLVAFLALVVNPPAPPGIAAFAPQANKPIIKAPLNQASSTGEGEGACAEGVVCDIKAAATTTTIPKLLKTGVPSSLQCYKWPDGTVTQTFDPQSPPCIAGWDDAKGNGGETSPGVSGTEIRVAFPKTSDSNSTYPHLQPIVDFLNTRYQFYGRKIRLVPYVSQQASNQVAAQSLNDPQMQRADASQVTQLKVFAAMDFVDPLHYSWSLPAYRSVLTKNKIVSIAGGEVAPYGTNADLAANAPYEWSTQSTLDTLMNNMATIICRQLAGKPATHANDPELKGKTRKFAILVPVDQDLGGSMPGLPQMINTMTGCGLPSPKVVHYAVERDQIAPMSAALTDLKNDGVTSVMFVPLVGAANNAHPIQIADRVDFRPEWVTLGWNSYLTASLLNAPASENAGIFGIGFWNKMPPLDQEMWVRIYKAAGGDMAPVYGGSIYNGRSVYAELMMLAAGIQAAGPRLTPETFGAGLQSIKFGNPGAAGPPFWQATVGFGPGDTVMMNDFQQFWLNPAGMTGTEVGTSTNVNTARAFCYVTQGRRWLLETWPGTDGYYTNGCQ